MSFLRPGRIALIGIAIIGSFLFFRESFKSGLGATVQSIGAGGESAGRGIESVLGGLGRGGSALLNPFFTLLDLAGRARDVFSGGSLTTPPLGGQPNTPGGGAIDVIPTPGIRETELLTTGALIPGRFVGSGPGGSAEQLFEYEVRTPTGAVSRVTTTARGIKFLADEKGFQIIRVITRVAPGGDSF